MPFTKFARLSPQTVTIFDAINDTTADATIPTLTAGTIDQTSGTIGITLTLSGSNATEYADYQWKRAETSGGTFTDITGETSATLDTTGLTAGFFVVEITDGEQTATTPEVEVAEAGTFAQQLFNVPGSVGWFAPITAEQYTDVAGTTVAVDGESVANWENLGDGTSITQDILADRPILRDPGGTPAYVEFDADRLDTSTKPETTGTIAIHFKNLSGTAGPTQQSFLDASTRVQILIGDDQVLFRVGSKTNGFVFADLITGQQPHTVAMSWNGSNVFGYIDGAQVSLAGGTSYTGSTLTDVVYTLFGSENNAIYAWFGIDRFLTVQDHADLHTEFAGYSA